MAIRALPIANPCSLAFAQMNGDERTRYCATCEKEVHDLSARTEDEARVLLTNAHGKRICVRYAKDGRGGIRFRAAATMAAAMSLAACTVATAPETTKIGAGQNVAQPSEVTPDEGDRDMGDVIVDAEDLCPEDPGPDDDGCPESP